MKKNETHNETNTDPASAGIRPLPWIAGALFVLGIAVIAGLYWNSVMKIHEVRFQGNYFVSAGELEEIDIPTDVSPDSVDFIQIIERIEQIPYVKRADVSVEPSGKLLVTITERQPVALLSGNGQKKYVDGEGLLLPQVRGKAVDVPIVYGLSSRRDTLNTESFRAVADFLDQVGKRPVSDATISEIAWTEEDGIVALTNQNGVKLIFGKHDFSSRLRNWEAFYSEIVKEKGMEQMRSVDLRFRGQIVTREA